MDLEKIADIVLPFGIKDGTNRVTNIYEDQDVDDETIKNVVNTILNPRMGSEEKYVIIPYEDEEDEYSTWCVCKRTCTTYGGVSANIYGYGGNVIGALRECEKNFHVLHKKYDSIKIKESGYKR